MSIINENIINKFCYINKKTKVIKLNYNIIKNTIDFNNYYIFSERLFKIINKGLEIEKTLILHINLYNLSLSDIDKHYKYICFIVNLLNQNYPNKLNTCYIYESSFIFNTLYSILSKIIDKKTREKIVFVETNFEDDNDDDIDKLYDIDIDDNLKDNLKDNITTEPNLIIN
jgi:hypothetical protein